MDIAEWLRGLGPIDLAVPQSMGGQVRQVLQLFADRCGFLPPSEQGFRTMDGEHPAGPRRGIGVVAELGFRARSDIFESDLIGLAEQMRGYVLHIARGLIREAGKRRAFGLGLDDAA